MVFAVVSYLNCLRPGYKQTLLVLPPVNREASGPAAYRWSIQDRHHFVHVVFVPARTLVYNLLVRHRCLRDRGCPRNVELDEAFWDRVAVGILYEHALSYFILLEFLVKETRQISRSFENFREYPSYQRKLLEHMKVSRKLSDKQ